jgi:alcohol dehydrogenase
MLGAVHACANPLTAHFNVVHGEAVGLLLPHVIRFNAQEASARAQYENLVSTSGLCSSAKAGSEPVEHLANAVGGILDELKMPRHLSERGVSEADLSKLSREAAQQWTGKFNPRSLTEEDFRQIFLNAL